MPSVPGRSYLNGFYHQRGLIAKPSAGLAYARIVCLLTLLHRRVIEQ
jgi:hypothetical protein